MTDKSNPLAFPVSYDVMGSHPDFQGMTLRDWFAGQCDVTAYRPANSFETANGRAASIAELAEYIAQIRLYEADAMLSARKEPTP